MAYSALDGIKAALSVDPPASSSKQPVGAEACVYFSVDGSESPGQPSTVGIAKITHDGGRNAAFSSLSASGMLVQLGSGVEAVDFASYKERQVAVLVSSEAAGANPQLMLYSYDGADFADVSGAAKGASLVQVCYQQGAVVQLAPGPGVRGRRLAYSRVQPPLAVSGPRGVACVFSSLARAAVLDLQEDEGSEGPGDGEEDVMASDDGS